MQTIYILFIGAIGLIIALGFGLELSSDIDDIIVYVLFWMLYIITIITFVNLILVSNYYLTMKDKTGIQGKPGPSGDVGVRGDTGLCDPSCRDNVCKENITTKIQNKLNDLNNGLPVKFNNVYIKSKIAQMCASNEFKQLAPYNGPSNLVSYMADVWDKWFDLIYTAGGIAYFENIGAETEFEWLSSNTQDGLELHNPFDELKKYDVFYWGMGRQYRPQLIDKCYNSYDGSSIDESDPGSIIKVSATNLYEEMLGNDNGSGSSNQVSFWRAQQFTYKGIVYYPVGDVVIGPTRANENNKQTRKVGNITIPHQTNGPNRETIIVSGDVRGPIDYELIWSNNSNSKKPLWLWRPIAHRDYISLGDIVTFKQTPPLTGDNAPIRCVPKSITIRKQPNGNRFWYCSTPRNASLLGFVPNDGSTFVTANGETNCYNLFRTVASIDTNIPDSDVNAGFYYLDKTKYDDKQIIGEFSTFPSTDKEKDKVGKGYLTTPRKDVKYSVMAYLNLKNNPILTHTMSKTNINAQLIPNAITNAYAINIGNGNNKKCLNYDGNSITLATCDESVSSQIFSIVFTGNKKNECKLQHHDSQYFIHFENDLFTLVPQTNTNNIEYQYFIMQ